MATAEATTIADSSSKSSDKRYERFLAKAEGYLHKHKANSHPSSTTIDILPATNSGGGGGDGCGDGDGSHHLKFFKKAQGYLHKKDTNENNGELKKKDKKDDEEDKDDDAMLKKIKKHKKGRGKGNNNEQGEVIGNKSEKAFQLISQLISTL